MDAALHSDALQQILVKEGKCSLKIVLCRVSNVHKTPSFLPTYFLLLFSTAMSRFKMHPIASTPSSGKGARLDLLGF